jgi:hypothetical protein
MQTLDIIFFVVLGPLTLTVTFISLIVDLKVACNKVTKDNEYYLHILLASKSVITGMYFVDALQEKDEFDGSLYS